MNILSIEAANFSLSIALLQKGEVKEIFTHPQAFDIESLILTAARDMLANHNVRFQDLDAVVTTSGPGSFTGIRMAMAAGQGIAMAIPCPCLAIDAFSLCRWWALESHGIKPHQPLLIALESKRPELFLQMGEGKPQNTTPQAFLERLTEMPQVVIGSAAKAFEELLSDALFINEMPQADALGRYAFTLLNKGHQPAEFPCIPFYLRAPDVHGTSK